MSDPKTITVFIPKGANIGQERIINTPNGPVIGRVVADLSGSKGSHEITRGGEKVSYDPAENYYNIEIPGDVPDGKAVY